MGASSRDGARRSEGRARRQAPVARTSVGSFCGGSARSRRRRPHTPPGRGATSGRAGALVRAPRTTLGRVGLLVRAAVPGADSIAARLCQEAAAGFRPDARPMSEASLHPWSLPPAHRVHVRRSSGAQPAGRPPPAHLSGSITSVEPVTTDLISGPPPPEASQNCAQLGHSVLLTTRPGAIRNPRCTRRGAPLHAAAEPLNPRIHEVATRGSRNRPDHQVIQERTNAEAAGQADRLITPFPAASAPVTPEVHFALEVERAVGRAMVRMEIRHHETERIRSSGNDGQRYEPQPFSSGRTIPELSRRAASYRTVSVRWSRPEGAREVVLRAKPDDSVRRPAAGA